MDELRNEIWDLLFRSEEPQQLGEIAHQLGRDPATIGAAVDHEWFQLDQDRVAIAYQTGSSGAMRS